MRNDFTTLSLKLPRNSEVTPESTLTFLSSLLNINSPISLEIVLQNKNINFQIVCHKNQSSFIESALQSAYPTITIQNLNKQKTYKFNKKLILKYGDFYPIKTFNDFKESDSLSTLLTLLSKANEEDVVCIKYHLQKTSNNWIQKANSYMTNNPEANKAPINEKISEPGFKVKIEILSNNNSLLNLISDSFNIFTNSAGNSFEVKRFPKLRNFSILNIKEIATLWHMPGNLIKTSGLSWGTEILSDPPLNLPTENVNFFAKTIFKNKETIFGIKDDDRRRHIWAIGKTGTGKSTLIANLAIDDIRKGKGLAVIDPHGDLADILLNHIPSSRINDVIYLNPADREFPISINPLEVTDKDEAEFVVSGIIAIFSKIFGQFWGPRLEYVLRNALLTLTTVPDSTLADVPRILTDSKFRKAILKDLDNKVLLNFWNNEFENLPPNLQKEVVFPILNKIGQFVTSPLLRNVIDKPKSTIDLEDIIDSGKILIANLSQGKIGEDNGRLLGAMLITKLQLAAMKRVNIPENERKDFYLFVDEFQNFATDSFIKILSEARKYHLNLMLANQYIDQIPVQVQKAILGNAGTLISFSAGAADARLLSQEFANVFTQDNLINMQNYQIAIRMMIDGHSERPFLANTLPLPKMVNGNKEKIIKVSRERWGKKVRQVV